MIKSKRSPVVSLITVFSLMFSLCSGILIMDNAAAQSRTERMKSNSVALPHYAQDLTKLARQGGLDIVNRRKAAVRPLIQILSRSQQNNPVLIGEYALNSSAVVEGLAQRIAAGRVPENLRQTRLYSLNCNALLEGAKTSEEIDSRLKAVLSEVSSDGHSILFVNELQQFVGKNAAQAVSATLTEAAAGGKVRLIGATSRGAYEEYIAGDALLDGLFQQINLEDAANSSDTASDDSDVTEDGFKGEKVSQDLRQLMQSANSNMKRVSVILQVDDIKNVQLNELFKRYGIEVNARMAQLGVIKIDVPVKALQELAARSDVRHLSGGNEIRAFGHVTATTGADLVRQQTTNSALGQQNYTLDGSGIGIAILDSGIDSSHKSFLSIGNNDRVVFSKDFTGENRTDDPYGHGTHVAGTAAGNGRIANGKYTGIASNANIMNLRVLNKNGSGSASGLLSALDWVMTNRTTYNIRVVNMSLECWRLTHTKMTLSVALFAAWLMRASSSSLRRVTMVRMVRVRKCTVRFTRRELSHRLSQLARRTPSEQMGAQTIGLHRIAPAVLRAVPIPMPAASSISTTLSNPTWSLPATNWFLLKQTTIFLSRCIRSSMRVSARMKIVVRCT